jgi:1-acyl-sn-glycerol-3-phosphate acyltransferase
MKRSASSALLGQLPSPQAASTRSPRGSIHAHQSGAEHGNPPSVLEGGIWLLWAGVGTSATLSSMGYGWMACNLSNFIFFLGWARTNVNIRYFFKTLFHFLAELFFKNFDVAGAARVPDTGSVILACAPHANQFVDGLVIMRSLSKRDVGFLTAAKSLKKAIIGPLIKAAQDPIAVTRPQDLAQRASGAVVAIEAAADGTLTLRGARTKFRDEAVVGSLMALSLDAEASGSAGAGLSAHFKVKVLSIGSDVELTLKQPPKGVPPPPLFSSTDGVQYSAKIVPHVDQTEMYSAVVDRLAEGGCVGVFPEGGSHDRTKLLSLKGGIAIMALETMSKNPGLEVTIVPVGLNYFLGHKFRSRVFVDIGEPFVPSQEQVAKYDAGGAAKKAACGELLDQLLVGIHTVTVEAPDYDTLQFYRALRRLYAGVEGEPLTAKERFALVHSFSLRYQVRPHFFCLLFYSPLLLLLTVSFVLARYQGVAAKPEVASLYAAVMAYREMLSERSMRDFHVIKADRRWRNAERKQNEAAAQSRGGGDDAVYGVSGDARARSSDAKGSAATRSLKIVTSACHPPPGGSVRVVSKRILAWRIGELYFMYRYIPRESCSQFDSLPLTCLTSVISKGSSSSSASPRCRARSSPPRCSCSRTTTRRRRPSRRKRVRRSRSPDAT